MFSDNSNCSAEGHVKVYDPNTGEIFCDKKNAIHFENLSEALALCFANKGYGFIHEMHFGNGGTSVDPTGIITYLPANNSGTDADLYNATYYKVVDDTSVLNNDTNRNKIVVKHTTGLVYTDIIVTCLLDYGEPSGQESFDNSTTLNSDFVFDELGLKAWSGDEVGTGVLLTHVIFHPIAKALNRLIQIDYTVRIRSLS